MPYTEGFSPPHIPSFFRCEVSSKHDTVSTLVQNYLLVPYKYKYTYLAGLLCQFKGHTSIIFVETCLGAQRLTLALRALGFTSVCLHGQMNQAQRLGALNHFKGGEKYRVMLATDVASRGLDIPSVDLVVNFDIPRNSKDYVHRVGRTARAGRSGRSVTLVTQYDVESLQRIEQFIERKLELYEGLGEAEVMPLHDRVMAALKHAQASEKELQLGGEGVGKKGKKKMSRGGRR